MGSRISTSSAHAAIWLAVLAAFTGFWFWGRALAPFAFDYPKAYILPARRWISAATKWLLNDASFGLFTFSDLTRAISRMIDLPYRAALGLLSDGLTLGAVTLPPISWLALIVAIGLLGHRTGGARLAALAAACFAFLAIFVGIAMMDSGQYQQVIIPDFATAVGSAVASE